jgi:tetratricopeptide (TPR) repeat protein
MNKKMYDSAIELYTQALRVEPNSAQLHYNLALAYSVSNIYDSAKEHYQAAVKLRPDYADAHNNLAISLYMLGEYKLALKHAQIAQKLGFNVSGQLLDELKRMSADTKDRD